MVSLGNLEKSLLIQRNIIFHGLAKDASPGPLFSKNFIDVGEGKLLGIINGRENYE